MPFGLLVTVLGWLVLGLEAGTRGVLSVAIGPLSAAPSFAIPLMVFICICASPSQALWSALGLGLATDLLWQYPTANEPLTVAGPYALGYFVAAQFILAARGLVIRRNPLTVAAVCVPAAAIVHIVVVATMTARHLWDPAIAWAPTTQLAARMIGSLLTGLSGLVFGVLLMPLAPALGLSAGPARHSARR
jgi:hypothetical protein